jgi:5-methylcytosine-specific restriction endonuclease McrA
LFAEPSLLHEEEIMPNPLSLSSLKDNELHASLPELCRREREVTLEILLHLNEVERRKLHLTRGYSSMFVYCTSWLGYSEPAAFRRIRTARCVARFPEIYALLQANEVNLSTIARVSGLLTANNKDALLARIRRRSRREVEAIVVEYEPQAKRRDVVRPVAVRVPVTLGSLELSCRADADSPGSCEKRAYLRREGDLHPTQTEKRVQFHFMASETFQRKLEKIRTIAWHRLPANASLEQVFELVMDEFIGKHDPRARKARRERRTRAQSRPKEMTSKRLSIESRSRRIAAATRDDVFVRDNAQCTFVGTDGRRCNEARNLHIDHVIPKAWNGSNGENNLRLLCARHNQLEAERVLGAGVTSRFRSP